MGKVTFRRVYKRYPGELRNAVDDFNLEVQDGEFLVLVGPSGCGKSTLLRMLAGLEDISDGEVFIDGELVNYVSPKDRNISMVFQNYALYPHMNVFENIAFGLRLRKMPKGQIQERVLSAARILEIQAHLDKLPKQMSGGQRQRVALGRAIVREPAVFLFDEPLSNLDAKLRVQMREELGQLYRRLKTTMIYVTHDQVEAMTMGTRIVVMKDGVIQQAATPSELYSRPANRFVAGFIGSPPMNFVRGKFLKRDGKSNFETNRYSLRIPEEKAAKLLERGLNDREVLLGVRAENVVYKAEEIAQPEFAFTQFEATIDMIESLGSDLYLYLNNREHKLIVRADPRIRFAEGDRIKIAMDMERALFFDPTTEALLC